jgi:hypothetical protein
MNVSSSSVAAAPLIALIVSLVFAIIGFIEQRFLRFGDKNTSRNNE